jgi:hypothetical protein
LQENYLHFFIISTSYFKHFVTNESLLANDEVKAL